MAALDREKRRAIHELAVHGGHAEPLHVTPELEAVMGALVDAGRRHARAEIAAMGVELPTTFADPIRTPTAATLRLLRRFAAVLDRGLNAIFLRARDETIGLELGGIAQDKLAAAVEEKVPGTLDLASRIVSGLLDSGLAEVYEQAEEFFPCWRYSAVLDSGTCVYCRALDGAEFESLAGLYTVLPNFGPNPLCLGDGRCRCRGVPCPPGDAPPTDFEGARVYTPRELVENEVRSSLMNRDVDAALDAIEQALPEIVSDQTVKRVVLKPEDPTPSKLGNIRAGGYEAKLNRMTGDMHSPTILMNRFDSLRRYTLVHEFGHYLDMQWLGRGNGDEDTGGFGSMKMTVGRDADMPWREEMTQLFLAIVNSPSVKQLLADKDDTLGIAQRLNAIPGRMPVSAGKIHDAIAYLTDPTELWARAFAQYVAEKSGDEQMLEWIRGNDGTDPLDTSPFPQQWPEWEFKFIAARMERLFDAVVRYSSS